MWLICQLWSSSSNISLWTFSPERLPSVKAVINLAASLVIMTETRNPFSCKRRIRSADLYAAMLPVTPRTTRLNLDTFFFLSSLFSGFRFTLWLFTPGLDDDFAGENFFQCNRGSFLRRG